MVDVPKRLVLREGEGGQEVEPVEAVVECHVLLV